MDMKQIGKYEVIKEVGRGGMATVYLAHDPTCDRNVALKVLPPQLTHDPTFHIRFEREAKTISRLEHNAIVPVYNFGEDNGLPYLEMRLMKGGTLADRLADGPIPVDMTVKIVERICGALDKAHSQGVIHCDISPGNILFDEEGLPYLADFGIARLVERVGSATITGTPTYMAPEQAANSGVDHRTDIYQVGVVLFEMLTGHPPFIADNTVGLLYLHAHAPIPSVREVVSELPPGLDSVIARAMSKSKEERFAEAGELARTLSFVVSRHQAENEKGKEPEEEEKPPPEDKPERLKPPPIEGRRPDDEYLEYSESLSSLWKYTSHLRTKLVEIADNLGRRYSRVAMEALSDYFESVGTDFIRFTNLSTTACHLAIRRSERRTKLAERIIALAKDIAKLFNQYYIDPDSYNRVDVRFLIEELVASVAELEGSVSSASAAVSSASKLLQT